jgi:hypothetical protein
MLWCQKIWNHNPVRTAIAVFENEDDLRVALTSALLPSGKTGTKAHRLAAQLLCDQLQAGLNKPGRLLSRAVWVFGETKLSDFSLVV